MFQLILRNLAVEYYKEKRYEEAYECFKAACEHEPDDPQLMDKVALSSLMCGMTDVTKATIEVMEKRWPENEQLMEMVWAHHYYLKLYNQGLALNVLRRSFQQLYNSGSYLPSDYIGGGGGGIY